MSSPSSSSEDTLSAGEFWALVVNLVASVFASKKYESVSFFHG